MIAGALRIEDFTDDQYEFFISYIWNGVGSDSLPKPPSFCFLPASVRHDAAYWIGGDEEMRRAADKDFLDNALAASSYYRDWKKRLYYTTASYVGYALLRCCGWFKSFEYGDPARTWDELVAKWHLRGGKEKKVLRLAYQLTEKVMA